MWNCIKIRPNQLAWFHLPKQASKIKLGLNCVQQPYLQLRVRCYFFYEQYITVGLKITKVQLRVNARSQYIHELWNYVNWISRNKRNQFLHHILPNIYTCTCSLWLTERVAAQAVIINIFIFTYLALLSNKLNSAKTKLAHILFNEVRMRIFSA